MKNIKMALIATAILFAVSAAVAARPRAQCENDVQYHDTGSGYVEAGMYGVNYACWASAGTCTYYKPDPINQPFTYAACRPGVWVPIQ